MEKIFIKARAGCRLWDPETGKFLPESGAQVKRTQYWGRRLKDGDAVIVPQKTAEKKPAPPPPAPPPPKSETEEKQDPPPPEKPKKKKGKK